MLNYNLPIIISVTKTATEEQAATVRRPFSLNAKTMATKKPTAAEVTYDVDEKMAGTVMTLKTA